MTDDDSPSTLYERIGGEEGIRSLVDRFYDKVLADPTLSHIFQDKSMDKLRTMQREFFAMATDGPVRYSGSPLGEIHRSLNISRVQFRNFTEHLIETLQETGADEQDVYEIISRVNIHADEITNEPGYGSD